MKLSLSFTLSSVITGAAARILNLWGKINDTWQNEQRNWDDII